jgi:hypothetical protein
MHEFFISSIHLKFDDWVRVRDVNAIRIFARNFLCVRTLPHFNYIRDANDIMQDRVRWHSGHGDITQLSGLTKLQMIVENS